MASNFKIEVKGVKGGMGAGARPAGIGSDVNTIRQKAIQAQKGSEKNTTVSAMKELTSAMKLLVQSDKALIEQLKKGAGGGVSGGESGVKGGASRSLASNAAAAFGGGFLASVIGFALSKSNMIGQAYISTAAEQSKNVGTGGFRYGQGMYTGSEMGSGMKSYAMNSGKFAQNKKVDESAIRMGNIYGLSADEALGQAGKFAKAGASYAQAANVGAGSGIQTQLPMFITAIGDQLEESVAAGIDTSSMSKTMATDMATLTAATLNKDVRTAQLISNSMKGVKTSIGDKGQIQNIDQLLEYKTTQGDILSGINKKGASGAAAIAKLKQNGDITPEQAKEMYKLQASGKEIKESDYQNITQGGLGYAVQGAVQRKSPTQIAADVNSSILKMYGGNVQQALQGAQNMGSDVTRASLNAQKAINSGGVLPEGAEQTGDYMNRVKSGAVTSSASGISVDLINQQTNLLLKHGGAFANATVTATKELLLLSDAVATTVESLYDRAGAAKKAGSQAIHGNFRDAARTLQEQALKDMENAWGASDKQKQAAKTKRQQMEAEDKKNAPQGN